MHQCLHGHLDRTHSLHPKKKKKKEGKKKRPAHKSPSQCTPPSTPPTPTPRLKYALTYCTVRPVPAPSATTCIRPKPFFPLPREHPHTAHSLVYRLNRTRGEKEWITYCMYVCMYVCAYVCTHASNPPPPLPPLLHTHTNSAVKRYVLQDKAPGHLLPIGRNSPNAFCLSGETEGWGGV